MKVSTIIAEIKKHQAKISKSRDALCKIHAALGYDDIEILDEGMQDLESAIDRFSEVV